MCVTVGMSVREVDVEDDFWVFWVFCMFWV
jgi:hypothetical protein